MGTWGTKINDNDTFQDIYQSFFALYNQGEEPVVITSQILEEFAEVFNDNEDSNNALFGLALAQWETQSLDSVIFTKVKEIIDSGNDIEIWRKLNADEKILQKRRKVLEEFLRRLLKDKEKPKRRVRPKFQYSSIKLLHLPAPDGRKTFEIIESYVNGEYKDTSSAIFWDTGGGSIFYFHAKGKFVTANWINSKTLEIHHDKTIVFTMKQEEFYYSGDQGKVEYISEELVF